MSFVVSFIGIIDVKMEKREYTPTKSSKILGAITNTQATSSSKTAEYPRGGDVAREYELLRAQVRQLEQQGRQLSAQADRLRYEKNLHENKYLQKASYEEEALAQCQKEKNYQLEKLRLKGEEDANRLRREFQLRLDELHRELKAKDYQTRELSEKNAYMELKANELRKGVETLEGELLRAREGSAALAERASREEFRKKELILATQELEELKAEMQAEIHVLLDIQAEKSRAISSLQIQLRNSEATERALHDKLTALTENFAALEEHIAVVKERLAGAERRCLEGEEEVGAIEAALASREANVVALKEQQVALREELQRQQAREMRREKELGELITENERLYQQLNSKRQRLHEMCISQGIDI